MKIGRYIVGQGKRPFLTAEIGGNHGGNYALAAKMLEAAAASNVSAVKFQAYKSSEFLSSQSPYYEELLAEELSFQDLADLIMLAHKCNICAGLSVFCEAGVQLALEAKADFIKIASGDIDNFPLLRRAKDSKLPIMFSTGASDEYEVKETLSFFKEAEKRLIIMQCTAAYPAQTDEADLDVMKAWLGCGFLAGYSDHTVGMDVAKAAMAMGAVALEKHFTIDRNLPGGDNAMSVLPEEMRELSCWADMCPRFWGSASKELKESEKAIKPLIRRAVVARCSLEEGTVLTDAHLALRRPGDGKKVLLGPKDIDKIVGARLNKNIKEGASITLDDINNVCCP